MAAPTSGPASRWRRGSTRLGARLTRYNFTVYVTVALVALFVLLSWAAYDFFRAIQHNDEKLQVAGLRSQLVEFLLATTREPDGSSLLDNADDYAQTRRTAKVVTVSKPFFGYFLTRENIKSFRKELVRTEQPRACILEYPVDIDELTRHSPNTVQVCLAAVQNDPSGRYVYAIIKYPTEKVTPHRRGYPLKGSDLFQLRFQFGKAPPTTLRLALEAPYLSAEARKRNPARFEGLYEVAGFLNEDSGQPTSMVSGQAIERAEQPDGPRFVTIAVRIDASVFNQRFDAWPDATVKGMSIGLEIHRLGSAPIVISETKKGSALVSLAQAYLTSVPSGAVLDIHKGSDTEQLFWSSKSLEPPGLQESPGIMQRIGDQIANLLKGETIRVSQTIQSPVSGPLTAELRSSGNVIPDLAARVLALLSIAAIIVLFLGGLVFYVASTIGKITGDALALAKHRHGDDWAKYKRRRDQVGTIGRVINYLDRRIRAEVERKSRTLVREATAIAQHQQSLRLIAHEIRSPVATLLVLNQKDDDTRRLLTRMQRAMEIFAEMRSVESTKDAARPAAHDLAASLLAYVSNLSSAERRMTYEGPQSVTLARYDDILLDQVLQNVLDNAQRYALPDTPIELRLSVHEGRDVEFEVFNHGPQVADTEEIFLCGHTSSDAAENLGVGLYAARQYVTSFGGSIHAENRSNGFAIVVKLAPA